MGKLWGYLSVGLAVALGSGAAGAAQGDSAAAVAASTGSACLVGSQLSTEMAGLGVDGSVEDYEASIMFAVSQSDCATDAIVEVLAGLAATPGMTGTQVAALENVIMKLKRRFRRGTAAIDEGGLFAASDYSLPVVDVGSGGSNYSN